MCIDLAMAEIFNYHDSQISDRIHNGLMTSPLPQTPSFHDLTQVYDYCTEHLSKHLNGYDIQNLAKYLHDNLDLLRAIIEIINSPFKSVPGKFNYRYILRWHFTQLQKIGQPIPITQFYELELIKRIIHQSGLGHL
jgi:hypothetical protein